MSMMMEHTDECVWRTNNAVNHSGVKNFEDCKCGCHEVSN